MLYEISSTGVWRRPDYLIEEYPCLKDFGFEVKEIEETYKGRIRDENGFPLYQPMTRIVKIPYINIDTIEQLHKLMEAVDEPLVIEKDGTIEIYDSYRE